MNPKHGYCNSCKKFISTPTQSCSECGTHLIACNWLLSEAKNNIYSDSSVRRELPTFDMIIKKCNKCKNKYVCLTNSTNDILMLDWNLIK